MHATWSSTRSTPSSETSLLPPLRFYVPRSHPDGIDVTVRCLDPGTVTRLIVTPFDDNERDAQIAAIAHLTQG